MYKRLLEWGVGGVNCTDTEERSDLKPPRLTYTGAACHCLSAFSQSQTSRSDISEFNNPFFFFLNQPGLLSNQSSPLKDTADFLLTRLFGVTWDLFELCLSCVFAWRSGVQDRRVREVNLYIMFTWTLLQIKHHNYSAHCVGPVISKLNQNWTEQ